jgi:competence protein ComEC
MSKDNTARSLLIPTDSRIVVRACFLYVGQGSSILLLIRDGSEYRSVLVDCNLDKKNGGIDMSALMKDVCADGHLFAFVNTHPHDDHLHGLKELADSVTIDRVWHSGHVPSKKHGTYHPDLIALIKAVEKREGAEAVLELSGSRSEWSICDASIHELAPADYVREEVNEADADARYPRIHENCAVFKIGKAPSWLLITGDADLVAFRDHITKYHKERLTAFALDASHHGSRSFFKKDEADEPYLDALEAIDPEYVMISAPTSEESEFEHPHDDAVKLYADHVGADKVFHTGEERESFIFDIYDDGTHSECRSDEGELADEYGLEEEDGDKGGPGGSGKTEKSVGPFVLPAAPPQFTPRRYG